ncbi:hypothetical protein N3K66_006412 [Trichothecium roseum]|uniref:Uncharacterized protein n=1 Tax=Trichothecium roseum TaxID=47278 RepID=A0ACC0UWL1_9HYPO|nr:hypothetical protein N3K66_006412 [Trichothecium roseum]
MQPETCNAVRRKVRNWIESGAMKVGEFQKEIGVSFKTYGSFMNRTKTWYGDNTVTYWNAMLLFRKRELQGLPLQVPKAKTAGAGAGAGASTTKAGAAKKQDQLLDTGDVELPGEDTGSVVVFELPRNIRTKLNALLKKGVTQAALARALSQMMPEGATVSTHVLRTFLGHRHIMDGSDSAAFYAGYVLCEKLRLKEGKPKSKFREEVEAAHGPRGVPTHIGKGTSFICFKDERPHYDKWGVLHFN